MAGNIINLKTSNGNTWQVDISKEINRGGEARIVPLPNGLVAKLYFDSSASISEKKINELSVLDENLFIKPIVSVTGDAKGFVMKELDSNSYFPLYSLYTKSFVLKKQLDKDYKKKVAKKLIDAVVLAHANDIVIGDLNPFNVMVNDKLDVKFIDVDSYQTKSFKHNGKLLEDIRDYAKNGVVSKESDYFSLAVIIFNLFTYLHPYKGNHKVYGNKLKDRMVNFCSVISNEKGNITIPKFYEPISDQKLLDEFDEIFDKGKRFLIDLDGKRVTMLDFANVATSDSLIITTIHIPYSIQYVNASNNYMAVSTSKYIYLYKTPAKGMMVNILMMENDMKSKLIVTDKYVYIFKDGEFSIFDENVKQFNEVKGISLREIFCIKQYENILMVFTCNDDMYTFYLDDYFGGCIPFTVSKCYHKSIKKVYGLHQKIGENCQILYNNGNHINFILMQKKNLQDVVQHGNVGYYSYWNAGTLKYNIFSIDKYNNLKEAEVDGFYPFASNGKFIMIGKDDKLCFINPETLLSIADFKVNGIEDYSILSTNAGIVIWNGKEIKLLNTK